jgi:ribosomal protein L20
MKEGVEGRMGWGLRRRRMRGRRRRFGMLWIRRIYGVRVRGRGYGGLLGMDDVGIGLMED